MDLIQYSKEGNLEKLARKADYSTIINNRSNLINFLHTFSAQFAGTAGMIYIMPSLLRLGREAREKAKDITNETINSKALKYLYGGFYSGIGLGLIFDIAQAEFYISQANDHPEIFLIPLLTNVVSGIYERRY